MNAHALLTSQGWRGHGHTLHATDDTTGLAKPILVSRKDNKLGVGKKEHATADQWWLNAFDQQLQGLDTSKPGVVVQTVTNGRLNAIATAGAGKYKGWASLYTSFVSGGLLEGTIKVKESSSSGSSSNGSGTETTATPEVEDGAPAVRKESREERRARKEARRKRKAERAARRVERAARRAAKAEAKLAKGKESEVEIKAERRARREDRRKRKEEKRRAKGDTG